MRYNTAVKAGVPKGKLVLPDTFTCEDLTVFQHDVCKGIDPRFRECGAMHTEIAWVAGYGKFTEDTIAQGSTFDEYCAAIGNMCRELKIPAFVVCGKQNVRKLAPDRVIPTFYLYHRIEALYAVFNYDGDFAPIDEFRGRDFVAEHFDNILDPCCGYGIIIPSLRKYGKRGVLSDINTACLEYINATFIQKEAD